MKKSEFLKEELKTLTDSFAIRSMKQRIALAESKEKNAPYDLVARAMKVVEGIDKSIDSFAQELMSLDQDDEIERYKEVNKIINDLIDSKTEMLKIIEKIKTNNM